MSLIGYMIDLSLVNSWLLYKRHAQSLKQLLIDLSEDEDLQETLELFKQQLNDILKSSKDFRISVRKSLRGVQQPKAGRPSKQKKRKVIVSPRGYRPDPAVRFDLKEHWSVVQTKQGRCKYCKDGYTTKKCFKCDLYLCVTKKRNCFFNFHYQNCC